MPGGGITSFAASRECGMVATRLMSGGGITSFAASRECGMVDTRLACPP